MQSCRVYFIAGYGNIACETTGGRIATCIYALFGIPLVPPSSPLGWVGIAGRH